MEREQICTINFMARKEGAYKGSSKACSGILLFLARHTQHNTPRYSYRYTKEQEKREKRRRYDEKGKPTGQAGMGYTGDIMSHISMLLCLPLYVSLCVCLLSSLDLAVYLPLTAFPEMNSVQQPVSGICSKHELSSGIGLQGQRSGARQRQHLSGRSALEPFTSTRRRSSRRSLSLAQGRPDLHVGRKRVIEKIRNMDIGQCTSVGNAGT